VRHEHVGTVKITWRFLITYDAIPNPRERKMSVFNDLSPILIPVTALLIPIVSVIAWVILKITRLHFLHETIRHLSEHGQPIPPELLSEITDSKSS